MKIHKLTFRRDGAEVWVAEEHISAVLPEAHLTTLWLEGGQIEVNEVPELQGNGLVFREREVTNRDFIGTDHLAEEGLY